MSRDGFLKLAMFKVDNKEEGKRVSGRRGQHVQGLEAGENLSLLRMWMSLSDIGDRVAAFPATRSLSGGALAWIAGEGPKHWLRWWKWGF